MTNARASRVLLLGAVLASLFACSPTDFLASIASPRQDTRARHYIAQLASGQQDSIIAHSRKITDTTSLLRGFAQIDSVFQRRQLDSMQLIGANKWSLNGHENLTLSYEAKRGTDWIGITFATFDSADVWFVTGVHAEVLPGEMVALNAFTLANRPIQSYVLLVAAAICTLGSLGTALFLASRRAFPKRWRWVISALIGVAAIDLNWTTGATRIRVFTVQLFSASIVRPNAFAPWVLSISLPLGAILAWRRYLKWKRSAEVPRGVAEATSASDVAT